MSEKIYQFNEYILSYDKGENDRSCLIISKCLLDKIYVMAELYDGSAELISTILDSLKQENKKQKEVINKAIEYIEKHIKYECDDAYNGMQFYSYHLYDFNKQELLDIFKEVLE